MNPTLSDDLLAMARVLARRDAGPQGCFNCALDGSVLRNEAPCVTCTVGPDDIGNWESRATKQAGLFFRSYHADESSYCVAIEDSEYDELLPYQDDLIRGNWGDSIADRCVDYIPVDGDTLDPERLIEVALC